MRRLYLLRATRRSYFGDVMPTEPSRFLEDIPLNLVSNAGAAGGRLSAGRASQQRRPSWDDDYNQDFSSGRDSGRVFGSGQPRANRPSPMSNPPSKPAAMPAKSSVPATPPPAAKSTIQQFKAGDLVRHNTFGEGVILKSEMVQDTEFVDVQFHGKYGKKRLSMDFAKLEKI
jgi:DNA helicase-2/ATP-dependent DNA helicase PcrA